MGLTERHWFENEDVPENYEWALEDAMYNSRTNKKRNDEVGMIDLEKVIKELMKLHGTKETMNVIFNAIVLLKEQVPREITKEEWESWKKAKHRDPLCMYWRGDITPFWILKPEDVHEPAYLIGDIKIFKGKPDKEKMYEIWEQDRGK